MSMARWSMATNEPLIEGSVFDKRLLEMEFRKTRNTTKHRKTETETETYLLDFAKA